MQALNTFLEVTQRLLLDRVTKNLFCLCVRLKSASLECLLQWPGYVEVAEEEILLQRMLQYLPTHALYLDHDGVCRKSLCCRASVFHIFGYKHCLTEPVRR